MTRSSTPRRNVGSQAPYRPTANANRPIARTTQKANVRTRKPNASTTLKYAHAVAMLESDNDMTIEAVADKFHLNPSSFRSYVRTWHPALLQIRRHKATISKYADAIAMLRTNPENSPTQVAKMYGYSPDTFRVYLRRHAPELLITGKRENGSSPCLYQRQTAARYDDAICFYNAYGGSLRSVAKRYGLIYNSFYSFLRRNQPHILYRNNRKGN